MAALTKESVNSPSFEICRLVPWKSERLDLEGIFTDDHHFLPEDKFVRVKEVWADYKGKIECKEGTLVGERQFMVDYRDGIDLSFMLVKFDGDNYISKVRRSRIQVLDGVIPNIPQIRELKAETSPKKVIRNRRPVSGEYFFKALQEESKTAGLILAGSKKGIISYTGKKVR